MRRQMLSLFLLPVLFTLAACQPAPQAENLRSVTVTGDGELSVAPEIATVRLGIEARDKNLQQAQARAGDVVAAVLELARALDIPENQVQSTQVRVMPEFDWHEGKQEFRGYLVQREVRVELEEMANLGPLVERAMRAGVNTISPPELSVKDSRALRREVLKLAAADARANADALAMTLDAELGKIRRISSLEDGGVQPKLEMQMMRAADQRGEDSYSAGRITVRASVQAEFELR